jgi:hypothetical protein
MYAGRSCHSQPAVKAPHECAQRLARLPSTGCRPPTIATMAVPTTAQVVRSVPESITLARLTSTGTKWRDRRATPLTYSSIAEGESSPPGPRASSGWCSDKFSEQGDRQAHHPDTARPASAGGVSMTGRAGVTSHLCGLPEYMSVCAAAPACPVTVDAWSP